MIVLKFDLETAYALEPGNESEENWRQWIGESLAAVEQICDVLERNNAPATFFIVGKVLEHAGQDFARMLTNPVFDIESHTYSHMVINRDDPAVLDKFDSELRRTAELIERYFAERPRGFCAPGGFYRGLRDCPKQLEILWQQGYTFVNTDGEGPPGQPMPAPFTQPYWYNEEGFPDILEIPVTGWHCNMLFNSGHQSDGYQPAQGFPDGTILEKLPSTVDEGFYARSKEFQFAIDNQLTYCPAMHPWSVYRFDPKLEHVHRLIRMAHENDVPVVNCRQVYEIFKRQKNNTAAMRGTLS